MHPYLVALLGGIILGLASTLFMLFNGRVLGISGIFKGLIMPMKGDIQWRLSFILGMLMTGAIYFAIHPQAFDNQISRSFYAYALAGLLVGMGTAFGSGCTSGHGICGISRLSLRSTLATITFMLTGAVSVYLVQHLMGGEI
ncbi:MAG: YeeE/YedE [SAR324 cluster bacterium]|uniref:YeeE/YedE n=1 Tax=SAR324 cluster bacterium TaxID=2024889 RepID=A0A2A4T9G4_9DELT|nr:MAG: YeeE/YedE [SAR324 cluster bacterium]